MWGNIVPFDTLLGKTLTRAEQVCEDKIIFETTEGEKFEMYHDQDCCEWVSIEDICGDLSDLVGSPILVADEATNVDEPPTSEWSESYTWTFYHLRTMKGTVTIRWYGESNGYYSESVDLHKVEG